MLLIQNKALKEDKDIQKQGCITYCSGEGDNVKAWESWNSIWNQQKCNCLGIWNLN